MSAGMENSDTIMVVREMPWHHHPNTIVLDNPPQEIEPAIAASGLDWEVEIQQLGYMKERTVGGGIFARKIRDEFISSVVPGGSEIMGTVRTDTGEILAVVSPQYKPFQNREQFEFLKDLLGSELEFTTAGSLHGGRRVYVTAKFPEMWEIGGDSVERYLYITGGHDGNNAVIIDSTLIRIVCANTLGMAESQVGPHRISFEHTGDMAAKSKLAAGMMQMAYEHQKKVKELGDKLSLLLMNPTTGLMDYLNAVYEPPKYNALQTEAAHKAAFVAYNRKLDKLAEIHSSKTAGAAPGSFWHGYNTVVEYQDWARKMVRGSDQIIRSFEDNTIKHRAMDVAAKMAGVSLS